MLYAPPEPNSGTAANTIRVHDRFARFRVSVRKAARPPHAESLAPLVATQERSHSPQSQLLYIPDGCTHVAGDPAHW
jgi:hypothetical protein